MGVCVWGAGAGNELVVFCLACHACAAQAASRCPELAESSRQRMLCNDISAESLAMYLTMLTLSSSNPQHLSQTSLARRLQASSIVKQGPVNTHPCTTM